MAKDNNKKPKVEAPVVENKEKVSELPATVLNDKGSMPSGMSQHDKVMYAAVLQHKKDELERRGGSVTAYEGLTAIEDAMIIDIAVTEMIVRKNPSGLILSGNEKNYTQIRLLASEMGVTLPEFKNLKTPTKEQLRLAGLTDVNGEGKVLLQLEDKNISKEAKEKVKAEQKLRDDAKTKEYLTDHTKIENEDQLKEALGFQLVNTKIASPASRLITTAQFYRSYLEARAEKSNNPEAELAKIHGYSLSELLQDVSTMVPPSFTTEGFGKMLCNRIASTKSVVPAFELFKRCFKNRKTGKYSFTDAEIADLVRILVVWEATAKIANLGKDIKLLSKDVKANTKAIEKANEEIKNKQELITYVTEPSFDLADNFIAAYNDENNEMHKTAKETAKSIIETYYKDVDIPELEMDTMLLNVQQHIGIVLNMFNSPVGKRDEYDEKNIISLSTEENKEKTEEVKEEKTPKN